jgi:hypothetical protein
VGRRLLGGRVPAALVPWQARCRALPAHRHACASFPGFLLPGACNSSLPERTLEENDLELETGWSWRNMVSR